MRQITKCDGKDSWIVAICDCRILWRFKIQLLIFMSVVQEGILLSTGNMYTSASDTINKVSFVNPLWDLNWYTYTQTDITANLRQNGQKWNFSYSCQKWTWVLSQVPRTRFQCYWTQFVPSRPWSQNTTNHKMRRQGFLNCRNLWRFKMQLLRFMSVVQEGILLSTGNMYTSTSDTINKVSFVNRLWDLKLIFIHTKRYNSEITPK